MSEIVEAPPATVLDTNLLRPRPNHWLQGVLAFLAVVGIGTALTVVLRPPVHLRVITVEKQVFVAAPAAPPAPPALAPNAPVAARPQPRVPRRPPPPKAAVKPLNPADCGDDLLCGIDKGAR
jgi:hypothetical protein